MTQIIQERSIEVWTERRLECDHTDIHGIVIEPGWGFGFPCDENWEPILNNEASAENYRKCLTGEHKVTPFKRTSWEQSCQVPAVLKCYCGREVFLDSFTCPCDCGRDYNMSGQLLAPRSQWGEETGECLSDILRIR